MFYSKEKFASMVDAMPLISVDLIIQKRDQVLLGRRLNRPAQGFWFVPGGRIMKNETISAALNRVLDQELSIATALNNHNIKPELMGAYQHFYDDSFVGDVGISTHYVVLGHRILLPDYIEIKQHDNQHAELSWWKIDDLIFADDVHVYTKDYFLK
ncbi:GDP-mannose mannosyl hydrolase [Methylobacillus gramineus]|uniref:GDP-mannose mannosyl hydrolase n=1 Tax=Methylobacillus gramineus TaxID=755169 RepID=UPI001CFFC38A|nr:GDP-mannose mannosyl hydrolase [Methylobacillus gramineus]MCB5183698.1 GDP-mannose mannosyl hydrolase [Methylobacillus gramineus]